MVTYEYGADAIMRLNDKMFVVAYKFKGKPVLLSIRLKYNFQHR